MAHSSDAPDDLCDAAKGPQVGVEPRGPWRPPAAPALPGRAGCPTAWGCGPAPLGSQAGGAVVVRRWGQRLTVWRETPSRRATSAWWMSCANSSAACRRRSSNAWGPLRCAAGLRRVAIRLLVLSRHHPVPLPQSSLAQAATLSSVWPDDPITYGLVAVAPLWSSTLGLGPPRPNRTFRHALGIGVVVWLALSIVGSGAAIGLSRIGQRETPGTSLPASPTTTVFPSTSSPTTTTHSLGVIKITSPLTGQSVGRDVRVTGTGTAPPDQYLWIFVYTSDERKYYAAGSVDTSVPDYWSLGGVILGGSVKEDRNKTPYTIYAVLADSQANTNIEKINGTGIGVHQIPGGADAQKVAHVTPLRTH